MLKSYYQFLNENKSTNINISHILLKKLKDMKNPLADLILKNLKISDKTRNKYADYLDYDEKTGMISYLINDIENQITTSNPYEIKSRKIIKPNKILSKILIDSEKETKDITQMDIQNFSNEMKAKIEKIEIWKGEDILKAYNYTDLIDMAKFSSSCANFNQEKAKNLGKDSWVEPKKHWYDVYVENPDNISVIVVIDQNGQVMGRRMLFTGEQFENSGDYKKGEKVGLAGNYYGIGGSYSVYDKMILDWVKDKNYETFENKRGGSFMIKLKNYKYPHFPPFDRFYINLENGVISYPNFNHSDKRCYKLIQNIE